MIVIEPLIERLAQRRPIFHSEADFQHEVAIELRAMDPDLKIRLEYPFSLDKRACLDIYLRKSEAQAGLELKYLCRSADLFIGTEHFRLAHQRAHDIRRYDVCKDVMRLEAFCKDRAASGGVLVLTNDPAYWQPRRRCDTFDAKFDLSDRRVLTGTLAWGSGTGKGTSIGREAPLVITGSYTLAWRDYSDVGGVGGRLRYLYIPVGTTASLAGKSL
jgi:hypothetical protein